MEHVWIRTMLTLALVLMAIKGLIVMVSPVFSGHSILILVPAMSVCIMFYFNFLEINAMPVPT